MKLLKNLYETVLSSQSLSSSFDLVLSLCAYYLKVYRCLGPNIFLQNKVK